MIAAAATPRTLRFFPLVESLRFRVSAMNSAPHGFPLPNRTEGPRPSKTLA